MAKGKIVLGLAAIAALSSAVVAQPVYADARDNSIDDVALLLSLAMGGATLGLVASDRNRGGDTNIITVPGASAD